MGKYFSSGHGDIISSHSGVCATAAAASGAVAYDGPTTTPPPLVDLNAMMCWKVAGRAVIINDKEFSWQAGFEMVNFNFHTEGTQQPVPTMAGLPLGPVA